MVRDMLGAEAKVVALPVLLLTALTGCKKGFIEEYVDGMRYLSTRANSQRNGTARIEMEVVAGETSMLVTGQVPAGHQVHVRSLTDPSGRVIFQAFDWTGTEYSKTNAGYVSDVVTINWPVDGSDDDLDVGPYTFEFGVVDDNQNYASQPLFFDALLKPDDDRSAGKLAIDLVFVDGLEDNDDLRDAVDEAVETWAELYAAVGIELDVEEYAFGEGSLEPPAFGDGDVYEEVAAATRFRAVNVLIAPTIASYEDIFGIAGDIPGPLVATTRSGVLISYEKSAGADLEFEPLERRLLAETMAHEVGHYLGLFHPVETTWDTWDALDDTADCTSELACIGELSSNLMFPFPVCSGLSCTPQEDVTSAQAEVVHRYVGVE